MGKVIGNFLNGYPGTVSRQKDDVIKSFRNTKGLEIPFGVPVFLDLSGGVEVHDENSMDNNFVGFTVRIPDKTPNVHPVDQFSPAPEASYLKGDPVDVLVRGSIIAQMEGSTRAGAQVYLRYADNALVTNPGDQDTTLKLPGVFVSKAKDGNGFAEIVITKRNLV